MLRFWLIRQKRVKFSWQNLLFFAGFVGITRGILEHILFGIDTSALDVIAYVPFYISLPFIYSFFISLIPGLSYKQILQPVTFAILLGLLPPIFDFILQSHETHSVFYGYFITDNYAEFPWSGFNRQSNYPPGEGITIWLTFFLVAAFVYSRSRSVKLILPSLLIGYTVYLFYSLIIPAIGMLLLFGAIPDLQTLDKIPFIYKKQIVYYISIIQLFIAFIIHSVKQGHFALFVKRSPHLLPFMAVTITGSLLATADYKGILSALFITSISTLSASNHNDIDNTEEQNSYDVFFLGILVMLLLAGYKAALLGFANYALSVLYHSRNYHARSTAFASMKIEGFWGFSSFLTGAMAGQLIYPDSRVIIYSVLFFGGFSLFSVLKDAKDIRADRHEKRRTVYTYIYLKGFSLKRFHVILSCLTGLLLLFSGVIYYTYRSELTFLSLHVIFSLFIFYLFLKSSQKKFFRAALISISLIIILHSVSFIK